ncbi:MAG: hypothetical protein K0S74_257 [Chlamydiales bacterium]|jgi:GcvH upstream region-like protein|nr:hypothetical protein [Chlamydiales bacterium]
MLHLFRKYQRFLFILISIVVISTFSFFGTYGTRGEPEKVEEILFIDKKGEQFLRSDIEQMILFLSGDYTEARGISKKGEVSSYLTNNFLIKDLFQSGLAAQIAQFHRDSLKKEFSEKLNREQKFQPYQHPYLPFISLESIWSRFIPQLKDHFESLKNSNDPLNQDSLEHRLQLYLAQKQVPETVFKQILYRQESQWVQGESDVLQRDLSLFGYRSMQDWFGQRYLQLVLQTIINTAAWAQQHGYSISAEEAKADLIYNFQLANRVIESNKIVNNEINWKHVEQYLITAGFRPNTILNLWQKVLLFKKLFQDVGGNVFIDSNLYKQFTEYATSTVKLELYELPEELRLSNYQALQELEVYLQATSNYLGTALQSNLLELPKEFYTANEVQKKYPELVQKKYRVKMASVDMRSIASKVTARESLDWLIHASNRSQLMEKFKELAINKDANAQQVLSALESLKEGNLNKRSEIDQYAREQITKLHPEWIEEALSHAQEEEQNLTVRFAGKNEAIEGLTNPKTLLDLLDTVPLEGDSKQVNLTDAQFDAIAKLENYTPDGIHHYRITVLDRFKGPEVLSYAEAKNSGILLELVSRVLKEHYQKIKLNYPDLFKLDGEQWKPFHLVKNQVADLYFTPVLEAVQKYYANTIAPNKSKMAANIPLSGDSAYPYRLHRYLSYIRMQIEKEGDDLPFIQDELPPSSEKQLVDNRKLADQWRLKKTKLSLQRGDQHSLLKIPDLFEYAADSWSGINCDLGGDSYFFHISKFAQSEKDLIPIVEQGQQLLRSEACKELLETIMQSQGV